MNLKDALAGGGQLLAGAALLVGALGGVALENQVSPADQLPNLNPMASSPLGFSCPGGWTTTRGTDPDTELDFTACESERYIIKALDGGTPQGFDKERGVFIDAEGLR